MSLHFFFLTEHLKRVVQAQGICEPQMGNHYLNVMAVFQYTFSSIWFVHNLLISTGPVGRLGY
jgi:hypothetical protein